MIKFRLHQFVENSLYTEAKVAEVTTKYIRLEHWQVFKHLRAVQSSQMKQFQELINGAVTTNQWSERCYWSFFSRLTY